MTHANRHVFCAVALVAVLFLPLAAQATKEKFVREKPHVNSRIIETGRRASDTSLFTELTPFQAKNSLP